MPAASGRPKMGDSRRLYYRFPLGDFQATVVSDGPIPLYGSMSETLQCISAAEMEQLLRDNFLPTDHMILEQNALVIDTGQHRVLFDTGSGTSGKFSPFTGTLLPNLRAAGLDPASIDAVVLTHAHWDHCWGLVAQDGTVNFPNARLFLCKQEFEFWTDADKLNRTDWVKTNVEIARDNLMPYAERMSFYEDGAEFLPGIRAILTPGHTVGHTVFLIESAGEALCFIGDLIHHQVLLVERPCIEFVYDTDRRQAIDSRLRILEMLVERRIPLLGYHFPWPGLGYIARHGDTYRYFVSPIKTVDDGQRQFPPGTTVRP